MKAWEVLKAVDEGKTVQYKSLNDGYWYSRSTGDIWVNDLYELEWRIKPEPRVLYVNEQRNGLFFAYRTALEAKSVRNDNCVGNVLKFVEEVSE